MSLVIGSDSQLAQYFPDDYEKISSKNIELDYYDLDYYKDKFYDRIFFCFGENRTFIENNIEIFFKVNVEYTLKLLDYFKDKCNKIIVYSTSELWNDCDGPIDLQTTINYNYSPYIESKSLLTRQIETKRTFELNYDNVIILYPFNFNSIYRKGEFLFGKIFDSILNKKHIEIGDTYFYRDLIHPKYVVERSILAEEDEIIGSGRLVFVNDFIRDLYRNCDLRYEDYVTENYDCNLKLKRKIYYLNSKEAKYNNLLEDTLNDIKNLK